MPLPADARLGPYEILGLLGKGGMGEVYRARDPRIGRDVAVKVLPAALSADPDRLRRFEQEVRAAGALNHPNILVIHDVGTHEGSPYLVSELLEGETLRERLRRGPIPPGKAIDYAFQTASGLAPAHEKGITHRDLKPENLFITRDGHVKILDFGLAKLTQPLEGKDQADVLTETAYTESGAILGTVGYMSPEQASGRAVDFRSDQFSFGAVAYEMATGKRAFQRASVPETLSAIIREEPEPITALHPQTPPPFRWLIERCLAKDPEDRFGTTRDLARDLESIRNHLAELAGPKETAPPKAPRRSWALVTAGLALAAIACAALWIWLGGSKPLQAPTLRNLTFSGHDSAPAASPDGRFVAFVSDRDGRRRVWLKELAGGGEVALTSGPDASPRFSPDGSTVLFTRSEEAHVALFRVPIVGGEPRRVLDYASDGDWSPDGRKIAFLRAGAVWVAAAGGEEAHELPSPRDAEIFSPRWSPNGRTIAASRRGFTLPLRIFLVGADGKDQRMLPAASGAFAISSVAWTAAGDEVVYAQSESGANPQLVQSPAWLVRHNLRSGATQKILWSQSFGYLLDVAGQGRVVLEANVFRDSLRELPTGGKSRSTQSRWLTRGDSQDRQPAYSPDGKWVIFHSNRSGNADIWKVSTEAGALRRLTDHPADDWDPAFTPDGKKIIWSSNRSGHFEIWTADADGSGARQLTRDGTDAQNPTMTQDGEWIVYSSFRRGRGIWKSRTDGSEATRLVDLGVIPEVSPDGRYAAYETMDGDLRVVRIADGADMHFVASGGFRPRWIPNGRAIAFLLEPPDPKRPGVFVQGFVPGRDTAQTRRMLVEVDAGHEIETFGISPDGTRVTIAVREPQTNLMQAENVPGIAPPARLAR
ncbi:MAG: PD40 domain-containing protein [Acidobacteria bacterium]|nr:PD40 domain-containing protein [Acidobacteriota bacterium]